ncbi:hypothetical protein [Actinomadura roseirufa]|uniref:hypothetical protein n=1 Tax=Actinomadura roseirufa TaxID=2094049 RepID=UPI001040E842|nr:hypothetical protein [Actinomadura roseirufa]
MSADEKARRPPSTESSTADRLQTALMRLAVEVVGAAYEEAMRTQGILPYSIKIITANARANLDALDGAHAATLPARQRPMQESRKPEASGG